MHVKRRVFAVMEGEPHLGTQTEYELIADEYEVQDWIIERAELDGYVQDEYEFEGVWIQSDEYVDVEMLNDYLENTDDITELGLYSAAFVKHKDER